METTEKIRIENNSIEKIDFLIQLAKEEIKIKPQRSLEYLHEAIAAGSKIDYKLGVARANLNAGMCYRQLSNFDQAFQHFGESLRLYKSIKDYRGESRVFNSIGNVHYSLITIKQSKLQ
jgi:tetratricopeptide (TPR) repeat protein